MITNFWILIILVIEITNLYWWCCQGQFIGASLQRLAWATLAVPLRRRCHHHQSLKVFWRQETSGFQLTSTVGKLLWRREFFFTLVVLMKFTMWKEKMELVQRWTQWNLNEKKASQFNQQRRIANGKIITSISSTRKPFNYHLLIFGYWLLKFL